MKDGKFRPNVGLMIVNPKGEVWLGKRADGSKYKYNEQMPQGGIDTGETPIEAAYRELWEETGLTKEKVTLIGESKHWHAYRFPHAIRFQNEIYIGQRQKWFLFLYKGDGGDFNLEVYPEEIEFVSYNWYPLNQMIERVVPFKRDVYTKVKNEFFDTIQKIIHQNVDVHTIL